MIRRLGVKRLSMLVLGASYLALFFDAFVGHNTEGGVHESPQYIPLVFAPVAFLVLVGAGMARLSARALGRVGLVIGVLSSLVGLGGVVFHLLPIRHDLADETLSYGSLMGALTSGPPLLAPAAFTALGMLVIAIAHARVTISIADAQQANEGAASGLPAPSTAAEQATTRAA